MGGMLRRRYPVHFVLSEGWRNYGTYSMYRHEWVYRWQRDGLMALLALGAVVALAACGGGESLTYEESVALLTSAGEKTVATAYSIEDTNISVVEMEDSQGEYIDYVFSLNYVPEQGVFGYQEIFNPYDPPEKSNFITTDDGRHFEYVESERCFSDSPKLTVQGGAVQMDLLYAGVNTRQNFIGGRRVIEDDLIKEIVEFETSEGGSFTFTVQGGVLTESAFYIESDDFGRLVGAGFDGRILAKKYVRRFYDIGVEKEFPASEPICE